MTLAKHILAKQRSLGISTNTELARRIGISLPTLYGILNNRRVPNARTIDAYARFLRVSSDRVQQLGGDRRASRPIGRRKTARR